LRVFGDHQKEFEAFKSSKDAEKFKEQDIAAKAAYESLNKQLDTLIEQSKSVDPRFSKLLKTWTTYSNERISKTNNLQSKVVEFLTLESSASVKESKRKELTALVDQVDKEVKGITQKMEYLEEEFDF
jgi:ubiquinone biosynthesis protein UbiJ